MAAWPVDAAAAADPSPERARPVAQSDPGHAEDAGFQGWLDARAGLLFALVIVVYALNAIASALLLTSGLDEGNYLMKSWWYVTGRVQPYGPEDPTLYMPLPFFLNGWWQRLVAPGLLSVRVLGALIGLLTLLATGALARRWLGRPWHGVAAAALLAATPLAVRYLTWDPQFGAVLLITLGTLLVLTRQDRDPWWVIALLAGTGYFLLYFFRVTMLAGIVGLLAFQLVVAERARWRVALGSLGVAGLLGAGLLAAFPAKLTFFAVWNPVVAAVVGAFGVANPYAADMGAVRFPDLAGSGAEGWVLGARAAVSGYVVPYLPVIAASALGLGIAVSRRDWRSPGAFACAYFLFMSAVHFFGSQAYCRGCIQPYTNYFYAVGALGGAYALAHAADEIRRRPPFRRGVRSGIAAWAAVTALVVSGSATLRFLTPPGDRYLQRVERVAALVARHVPPGERVLPLGALPYTTQGAFLAGRDLELTAINQDHSYYALPPELDDARRRELQLRLRELGLWSDPLMARWLDEAYDWVLWADEGEAFQRKWVPQVARAFRPVGAVEVGGTRVILSERSP